MLLLLPTVHPRNTKLSLKTASPVHQPRLDAASDRAGSSPARSAGAPPWPALPLRTLPRNHRPSEPEFPAGCLAPPSFDPMRSGGGWPVAAKALRPAGFPPALRAPSPPPSLRPLTMGALVSAPGGPSSASSPTPSGGPAGSCPSSPACPQRPPSTSPGLPASPTASSTQARSLPSRGLFGTPAWVLSTARTPSRLRALSAFQPYTHGLGPPRLPGRVAPVQHRSVPTCRRLYPAEVQHSLCIQHAACYLRRDLSGSVLCATLRLML